MQLLNRLAYTNLVPFTIKYVGFHGLQVGFNICYEEIVWESGSDLSVYVQPPLTHLKRGGYRSSPRQQKNMQDRNTFFWGQLNQKVFIRKGKIKKKTFYKDYNAGLGKSESHG